MPSVEKRQGLLPAASFYPHISIIFSECQATLLKHLTSPMCMRYYGVYSIMKCSLSDALKANILDVRKGT